MYKINKIPKFIFLILITIYYFGWTVPICCQKDLKPGIFQIFQKAKIQFDKRID